MNIEFILGIWNQNESETMVSEMLLLGRKTYKIKKCRWKDGSEKKFI